ncbi:hypothetical protein MSG28_007243 [Choristoneura fumiferana]|uniref:Uncharacterized protein n=1 Tax=Choristoneura fumiferana TaxID=7141 RepID=A0ACC0JWA6_CHOFU|nr:hypothetical protein MSG28_007243 [Choristoneura fumiferana]
MQARVPMRTPRLPMRSLRVFAPMQRSNPMRSLVLVFVLCVTFRECQAIRVPISWDNGTNSEVSQSQVEQFTPVTLQQIIPAEYFEYKAHKPQFAVDVAAFHGVKNPENHYKAYPIRPFTGKSKPDLGKHHMLDEDKKIYRPFQQYVNENEEWQSHIMPTMSSYKVYHPYKAEEPALQELYKDPILDKIRNDLKNSKENLQKYEKDAGEADIEEGEYLESPEQTDRKKFPQRNVPAPFEIHRPLRRPVYYRPPPKAFTREQILNHKFRHPWNQNFVKVRPLHYRPLKNHLHNLRQHHSLKYDDEHNEYPQVPPSENFAEPPDGYDIYLKGQAKYNQLRNNIDESINRAVLKNRPAAYQKLELQNQDTIDDSDENEFVRKTESTKHLPKSAALEDAASYDDIVNAHRLREAVKSTRAQTVYSEEGYEDAAYDHAGEQKHASDHEAHGGLLKEKEISGGKYKTPSFNGKYEDASSSIYKDKKHHGKKWKNDDKDTEQQNDSEDYTEDEFEHSEEEDAYGNVPDDDTRHKREHSTKHDQNNDSTQEILSQTESDGEEIDDKDDKTSTHEESRPKRENVVEKDYEIKESATNLAEDSPLRYAENLKFIPQKSKGGTEFYDSRSNIECSEVDDDIDPIPEKIKNNGTKSLDDNDSDDGDDDTPKDDKKQFDDQRNKQRLKGLGDKIDCFKAKYFGKNPLDSPFFKEDIIAAPKPIKTPNLETFRLNQFKKNIFEDHRRGEPRYELSPANHKSQYTPVNHKKAMSVEDYESQTNTTIVPSRHSKALKRIFDDPGFQQSSLESAASKTIRRVISTTSSPRKIKNSAEAKPAETDEEYDEYEDDEDEITTTTTTIKPSFKRRTRPTTTTLKPSDDYEDDEEETTELPKLHLVTRFQKPYQTEKPEIKKEPVKVKYSENDKDDNTNGPKYREKKKKTRKSTLVTDTQRYGNDDDDDMRKEEVDALIEPPPSTTEARSAKLDVKPVVHKKKVEIHKELPVNTSAPHVTQFKQDIQEVEIIKEMPQNRRKPNKNLEALDLFKDEKLAEEVNKLKDVEIFRENLNLKQGPKHGGNYRSAEIKAAPVVSSTPIPTRRREPAKYNIAEKTQVEAKVDDKDIEVKRNRHGGHLKSRIDQRLKDNEASNAKHIELSDVDQPPRVLHGGNLRSIQDKYKPPANNRNAKLVELDDEYESDDDSSDMHGGNFKSYDNSRAGGRLHGGNYRSAKLIQAEAPKGDTEKKDKAALQARSRNVQGVRNNAAAILNGFAQAVPILTTTPNYILDPRKPIPEAKLKDLKSLLHLIPQEYHSFTNSGLQGVDQKETQTARDAMGHGCVKYGGVRYDEVERTRGSANRWTVERCHGPRSFLREGFPCVRYSGHYFTTTLIYSACIRPMVAAFSQTRRTDNDNKGNQKDGGRKRILF